MRINEIYRAIQGEGFHTGRPCTIVRSQGCNLQCSFCDTRYARDGSAEGAKMTPGELMNAVRAIHYRRDMILITGGEPTIWSGLMDTIPMLSELGPCHLETNGTTSVYTGDFAWVTVSPKEMVRADMVAVADEVKFLIIDELDVHRAVSFKHRYWTKKGAIFSLQPMSCDKLATAIARVACMKYGWRLSLQTHKLTGAR